MKWRSLKLLLSKIQKKYRFLPVSRYVMLHISCGVGNLVASRVHMVHFYKIHLHSGSRVFPEFSRIPFESKQFQFQKHLWEMLVKWSNRNPQQIRTPKILDPPLICEVIFHDLFFFLSFFGIYFSACSCTCWKWLTNLQRSNSSWEFRLGNDKWAVSSEFVSSSIPSWQILTAHVQPSRGARDLAFCLKVPLDSLLVWASSGGSGETARMRRLAWTIAARIGDKYQIRLTRPKWQWQMFITN